MGRSVPTIDFDRAKAQPLFPQPLVKHAILIQVPKGVQGFQIPSSLDSSWGGQVFVGDFYAIIPFGEEVTRYGSAKLEWEGMHVRLRPRYWVKTGVPTGYQVDRACRVKTRIPTHGTSVEETTAEMRKGDWVLVQPAGEIQHVQHEKFPGIYFMPEQAAALGLARMTPEQFRDWAVRQAWTQNSWLHNVVG
jgi:hypothetical protein